MKLKNIFLASSLVISTNIFAQNLSGPQSHVSCNSISFDNLQQSGKIHIFFDGPMNAETINSLAIEGHYNDESISSSVAIKATVAKMTLHDSYEDSYWGMGGYHSTKVNIYALSLELNGNLSISYTVNGCFPTPSTYKKAYTICKEYITSK